MNCELKRSLEANLILDWSFKLNKNRATYSQVPREPEESFPFSLNTLGEVEMIIQGEAMKALIHRGCLFSFEVKWSEVTQSCPNLCNPVDCSLSGSSVHGIFLARVLEWVAISFSRGSFWPRDWTLVSRIVGRRFTVWATILLSRSKLYFHHE